MNLINEKNLIKKAKEYLSEIYTEKDKIVKAYKYQYKEYKLNSGNILFLQENIFINLHLLLKNEKSRILCGTEFYLPFLKEWKYFLGFDKRCFSKHRHYILPSGYVRARFGGIHYGDYFEKKENDLYAYAIENYYKNIHSLYDDENEYGEIVWIFIYDFLQYLNSYKDESLETLIVEWTDQFSDMYLRIQSTKEDNMIHKYTYKAPPPKSERQLREEREETRRELQRLTEWEEQYDARKAAEEASRRSEIFW